MTLAPGIRLALRPFGRLRVAPSNVEGRQAQGGLEQGRKVGHHEIAALERRFPELKGRLWTSTVPLDRATFRHPQTGAEIKAIVTAMLSAPPQSGDPTARKGIR